MYLTLLFLVKMSNLLHLLIVNNMTTIKRFMLQLNMRICVRFPTYETLYFTNAF